MSAATHKLVYAIGLFLLAACAVTPRPRAPMLIANTISAPLSTENRLANAITARIGLEVSDKVHDYRLTELVAEADGLRRLAFEDDALGAREELIDALADELSAALAKRAELAACTDPDAAGLAQIDALVRGLTAAINAEVHSLAT